MLGNTSVTFENLNNDSSIISDWVLISGKCFLMISSQSAKYSVFLLILDTFRLVFYFEQRIEN